jgi:pimeloyl-ACP methyl ester carboxylesterase
MTELRHIATGPGLAFDAFVDGPADAPLVLLLHGASESFHMWRAQLPALAAAGFRAVAPSQRGYSAGARPPTDDLANYTFDLLLADAMSIVAACGHGARPFHLVGHDWGGSIAWGIADKHAARLASLTVLSRPHPTAFNHALALPDGEQARRSRHHKAFLAPDAGALLLADGARRLRNRWTAAGVPAAAIEAHLSVIGDPTAMEGMLAWYRARGALRAPLGPIRVPTLYIWGDADDSVGCAAAEGTRDFVTGPFRFETVPGGSHFVAEQTPQRVNEVLLAHLRANSEVASSE